MPQSATHVYLALSSPLVRIRMRHALANTFGIHVMDEVGDPIQAAEGIRNCEPQVIVCDERMIMDPTLLGVLRARRGRFAYRVVLITGNARVGEQLGGIQIVDQLPIDLPSDELAQRLHEAAMAELRAEQPAGDQRSQSQRLRVTQAQGRFVIAEQPARISFRTAPLAPPGAILPTAPAPRSPSPEPSGQHQFGRRGATSEFGSQTEQAANAPPAISRVEAALSGRLNGRQTHSTCRRARRGTYDRLAKVFRAMQAERIHLQRDDVTGLANTRGLGMALRALPNVNQPAGVVVLDLWYGSDSHVPADPAQQQIFLSSLGAIISGTVRQDDLICRIEGMTFAIVFPGLDPETASIPMHRLRRALVNVRYPVGNGTGELTVAMGSGFWQPGVPSAEPLDRAWQAMKAERAQPR